MELRGVSVAALALPAFSVEITVSIAFAACILFVGVVAGVRDHGPGYCVSCHRVTVRHDLHGAVHARLATADDVVAGSPHGGQPTVGALVVAVLIVLRGVARNCCWRCIPAVARRRDS